MTAPSSNDPFRDGRAAIDAMLKTGKGGRVTVTGDSWTGTPGDITYTPGSVEARTDDQGRKTLATTITNAPPPPPPPTTPLTPPVTTTTYVQDGILSTEWEQLPAVITTTNPDGKQSTQITGAAVAYTVSAPPVRPLPIKSLWQRLVNLINSLFARIIQIKRDYLSR